LRDLGVSARLQGAVEAQVAAGAPGAVARIDAPRAGLTWGGSAGYLARGSSRALRPDDAFRAASVTKSVTAAVAVSLAHQGRLALDEPLADQLAPELVDHAAAFGTPRFLPGRGFEYCDTGYVVTGILVEQATGQPLHEVYRELVFDPAGMDSTWLEGYEPARQPEAAHHYTGELDWTTISPTIDWAGGGLVTTAPDLARFVRTLWSERIAGSRVLDELTRWTPGASFPPGHALRYERYGLGMGTNTVEGVELIGHTGFIGAFAFHAPQYDAVLAGTHNDSQVDRWPLVAALCRELRQAA
jgi:D-alanyl-D-alanine carboxypeptidase